MPTMQVSVERFSVISKKSFGEVTKALEGSIGHPDMRTFESDIMTAKSFADVENFIAGVTGKSGLMQFMRFNLGGVVQKECVKASQSFRYLIGNPLVMKRMVENVPDAGSYAPVTVLVDERPEGVTLSYDRMSSFLASYQNEQALTVARELDAKIEAILTKAAS